MATITLIDLMGTDNVALGRTDINKNFQTVENALNTLESFLDTTPAGGTLSIGSVTLNVGSNPISTVLLNNTGSGLIQGNLTINQGLTVTGNAALGGDISIANKLLITGAGPSAGIVIGDSGKVSLNLRNITLIDEQLATATPYDATAQTVATTGIHSFVTSGLRAVVLNYTGIATGKANVIQLDAGTVGQRIHFSISEHGDPAGVNPTIWFAKTNFNGKYDQANGGSDLAIGASYDGVNTAAIPVALGIPGTTSADYSRKFVELVYKTTGWEVYSTHPSIDGI